ncbi:MAG: hypothetical protein HYS12_01735 [Planctomycetes bacterium]|nr:hypothetical protein [Planctomycetota bacterium]
MKSRKTQLGTPDPAVEAEGRHADEGRSPAGEDRPASPDLPAAPVSGMLPPPGDEGLSLAGVAPARDPPNDGTPAAGPRAVDSVPARNALSLEERVRRLEDIVATLQLSPNAIQPAGNGPAPNEQASLADFIASAAQHFPTQPQGPPADPGAPAGERTQRWLPFELLAEMRVMVRMYLDPRYRLTWQTRVLPPVFLFGMFLSWLLISGIPVVGFLFDRILDLVLAYMLFKVLMREATRYRMMSPDLPLTLRL